MAGEINGTNIILQNSTGAIVGQGSMTLTYAGNLIDISNKSFEDYITLMDGELASRQLTMAGDFVYNNDAQFAKCRLDSLTGKQDTYTVTYTSANTTDESFVALMAPQPFADALPHGDKVTTTMAFVSSGAITHTPAVA